MVRLNDLLLQGPAIKRIAARHGARNVAVFGSVARGEDTAESDIDLLLDLDPDRSLLDRIALKHELEDLFGRSVGVINRRGLKPLLSQRAVQEAVEL